MAHCIRPSARIALMPFAAALLLLNALWSSGCSAADPSFVDPTLIVRGGWVFDGTGDGFVRNRGIGIRDSVILFVNEDPTQEQLAAAELLELDEQQHIIPGMLDLHAHYAVDLTGQGRVDDDEVYPALFLANGVTTTFPAGEVNPDKMRALRIRIDNGAQAGPRVLNSGPYFGAAREGWNPATTAAEISEEVDILVARGARGFKAKNIEAQHLEALIEAAHRHGLTVTGHLGSGYRGSVNPRDAILMGIDRIEHFEGGDAMTPDRPAYESLVEMRPDMPEFQDVVRLYIRHGVHYNATLSAYGYYGRRDPEVYTYFVQEMDYLTPYARDLVQARLPRRVSEQFESIYWTKRPLVKQFYDLGGAELITLGTDHPSWGEYFSGFAVHRELHSLVLAGIPPAAALRIATVNGARALRVDDRLGTLEAGKLADLVIMHGDPLQDITNTRNVHTVIKGGIRYSSRELLESVKGKLGPRGPEEVKWW